LKVETTPLENRVLKVVVEATPEETETARRTAALKLGKKVRVPGFRPGKAPYPILLKHLDPFLLQEETIEVFIDKAYPEILKQEKIEPFDQGRLESILELDPLKLEIHIPLKPLVDLGDYRSIRIPYEPPVVTDEDVDKELDRLRQQNPLIEPVERPIQEGDVVFVDLISYRKENGEITDQIILDQKDIPLQVFPENKKDFWEYPFQGFSKVLIGKQAHDQFSIDYHFPEDSPSFSFKGMDVHFEVTIKQVKAQILPDLDDEFAQSVGEYSSINELRTAVRSLLEQQAKEEYLEEFDSKVMQEVINCSTFEYPLEIFESERNAYLDELRKRLEKLKIDLDLYKKIRGLTEEQFEEELKEVVDRRIKSSLALLEIAKKEDVNIDPYKALEKTQKAMQIFLENPKDTHIPKQLLEELAHRLSQRNLIDQVYNSAVERLRQIAKGEIHNEEILSKPDDSGSEEIRESEIAAENVPQENFANDKSGLE